MDTWTRHRAEQHPRDIHPVDHPPGRRVRALGRMWGLPLVVGVVVLSLLGLAAPASAQTGPITFRFTTWNIGRNGTGADLAGLVRRSDAIALQEAGDQQRMIARTLPAGWGVRKGAKPYEVLAYDKSKLRMFREINYFLTPATKVGDAGAGGTWQGEKRIIGGDFKNPATRRNFSLGSVHLTPTQSLPIRRRLALQQTAGIADWAKQQHWLPMVAGDFNAQPSSSVFDSMRKAGMVNDQDLLGKLPTHGNAAIDHVWFVPRPGRMRLLSHYTVGTSSDHKALVVRFRVTHR